MTFDEWYGGGPGVADHDPALAEEMRKVARLAWNAAKNDMEERVVAMMADREKGYRSACISLHQEIHRLSAAILRVLTVAHGDDRTMGDVCDAVSRELAPLFGAWH